MELRCKPLECIDWGCCNVELENSDYVLCSICRKGYHLDCMLLTSPEKYAAGQVVFPNWACPQSSNRSKGGNSDNTLLRSQSNVTRPPKRAALNSPPKAESNLTRDDVRDVVQELCTMEMEKLFIRLGQQIRATMTTVLAPIKKEMSELRASIAFINGQCDDVITK